ncbi:MAG: hypothetical protein F2813_06490 [Actinobacteria bacterium]|uniref:Unannotated protein n=1 Tax=freshwater metagenome TaxID=449393 RepID=A0A6J5ZXF6_9ZZZZ|nr:hypothetical protein [Actinomycetota bacterium]
MSDQPETPDEVEVPVAPEGADPAQMSEEEMRAAYEAELKALRVEDLVAQTVVSLLNLGARKAGLLPGSEDEADPVQVSIAIEGIRRLLPLIEPALGENAASIKDALAQLQVAFAKMTGETVPSGDDAGGAESSPAPASAEPDGGTEEPGKSSGGLWTPGP